MTNLEERVRDAYQTAGLTVRTLHKSSPVLSAAGSAPARRRLRAFAPLAAAMAVVAAAGVSVAVPRLLAGAPGNQAPPRAQAPRGNATSAPGPFRVVLAFYPAPAHQGVLLVQSATNGQDLSTLIPERGRSFVGVAATRDATRFVVAAAATLQANPPDQLYTLTLSAHGKVTGLTPIGPALTGELGQIAASADGNTIAFLDFEPTKETFVIGVITGGRMRAWSIHGQQSSGFSPDISLSGDGRLLTFITLSPRGPAGQEQTAWVLPTDSAPGSLTATARKVYSVRTNGTYLESAQISQDGSELYLCTRATSPSGKTVTSVTARSTADGTAVATLLTVRGDSPLTALVPVGGMVLVWAPDSFQSASRPGDTTAYLINPATRTSTTLRLRGIPRAQAMTLAW